MKILCSFFALWVGASMGLGKMEFVHPGARDSVERLDFVKVQIAAGAEPWAGEFARLKGSSSASRASHAKEFIDSTNDAEANSSREDALAAYTQALLWYFSGEEDYAERSIAILNAWSALQGFDGGSDQDKLQAGWIGAVFAPAAEIMRGYEGWGSEEVGALQAMFRRAFYPQLGVASSWNGNVDLTQIDAIMAIAVFCEDEEFFAAGLARLERRNAAYFYLESDGALPSPIDGDGGDLERFWSEPTRWVDGLTQETCRDNGHHSQFALGSAIHASEVAWNQGVDVYTQNRDRYVAAMELLAEQLVSGDVDTCAKRKASRSIFNTWEMGFNHYRNRMGVEMPNTELLILERVRPESPRAVWNLAYETLTHAGALAE